MDTDIDECADSGTHTCSGGSECLNSEGSYDCVCSTGYQLSQDGSSCQLVTTEGPATTQSSTTPSGKKTVPDTKHEYINYRNQEYISLCLYIGVVIASLV